MMIFYIDIPAGDLDDMIYGNSQDRPVSNR